MKKIILSLLLLINTTLLFSQNSSSGSAYTLSRPSGTDCSLSAANVVRFGNGTTRLEICLTTNNLVTTCGGGDNKDDQVYFYEDQNNDGTPETFINGFIPTTPNGTCIMSSTSGNGYLYLLFCPAGTCDAGDKSTSNVILNWSSYSVPPNNLIGNPVVISNCSVGFTANNYNANNTGNCAGLTGNSGPPTNSVVTFYNNLDCNVSTTGGTTLGGDVGFSAENDIWYKFCPGVTGTWQMVITPSNCYTTGGGLKQTTYGFQYALFQGVDSNLGNVITGGVAGDNWTTTQTINIVVSSIVNCYYLYIDGYGGTGCKYSVVITPPSGLCTILPIELISFNGYRNNNIVKLEWVTATELNNERFELMRSYDAVVFSKVGEVIGSGNSLSIKKYHYSDYVDYSGILYYKLIQYDYDGKYTSSNIISINYDERLNNKTIIKITNILGQVVDSDYDGYKIIFYSDGSCNKIR